MINSTSSSSSSNRAALATALAANSPKSPAAEMSASSSDTLSTDKAAQLKNALASTPEVRPEVVARGQALAADPSYPSAAVIKSVASTIVNSPDLSEDES